MPESNVISNETREKLEALCQKISVSYDLDPEIRKELFGHMEDRLLAHLSGEAPLTEKDAFELVSKQFGDPTVIQELFQGVYLKEMTASMGRRMVAALVAFTLVSFFNKALYASAAMFPALVGSWCEPHQIWFFIMYNLVVMPGIMYLILRSWKTNINRGKRVWFQAWSIECIILVFFTVTVVLLPSTQLCCIEFPMFQFMPPDDVLGQFLRGVISLGFVVMGILWMWFCAQPPRPRNSLHWAASGFAFMSCIPTMTLYVYYTWPMINYDRLLITACYGFLLSFVFAEIMLLLYWVIIGLYQLTKRFRRNSDEPLQPA